MYMLIVHSVTLTRLNILPEDRTIGTETCRRFYGIFSILLCVNVLEFYLYKQKTRVQVVGCLTLYLIFLQGIKMKTATMTSTGLWYPSGIVKDEHKKSQ